MHVCYLVVSRLLPLVAKYATFFKNKITYILLEITLIYILLIRLKLYVATVISLQFMKKGKQIQMYQYLFYDY